MTKTMQPVLPEISDTKVASPDWWYVIRSQTLNAIDNAHFWKKSLTNEIKKIDVELISDIYELDFDCKHTLTHKEEVSSIEYDVRGQEHEVWDYIEVCNNPNCNKQKNTLGEWVND